MGIDLSGAVTTALDPLAALATRLAAGDAAWGWAVLLAGLGLRALQVPLLLRVTQYRVARARHGPERAAALRHPGLAGAVTVTQLVPVVALFVWTRDAAAPAATAGFYGVETLGGRALGAGWGGWLAILAVVAATLLVQRQTQPPGDERQAWFFSRVAPVVLLVVAAILPVAVLLFWITSTAGVALVHALVARRLPHEAGSGAVAG